MSKLSTSRQATSDSIKRNCLTTPQYFLTPW